jgi:hypothetical protein
MDNKLLPCPMCGNQDGYTLSEGSTYRWWNVNCKGCGRMIDECASDRRTSIGTPLPEHCEIADEAWNEAADYAGKLRQQLAEQTSGEPVATIEVNGFGQYHTNVLYGEHPPYPWHKLERGVKHNLYTAPPSVEVLLEALRKWRLEYDVNSDQMIVEQTGFGGCVVKQYAADIADEVLFKFSKDILDALNAYSAKPQNPVSVHTDSDSN